MTPSNPGLTIDDLIDRAIEAINAGDPGAAARYAGQVLDVDGANADAEDLLAAPTNGGEIRRLTIFFADLVDSTVLSTRTDMETYRTVVGTYRDRVLRIVSRYEGHVGNTKGDGLLGVFGHPRAHENDVRRAVQAGLEMTREIATLSEQVERRFGFPISIRVGVHRGVVYLDTVQDDVYGLAANLTARVSALAPPGTVVVSGAIEPLLRRDYELQRLPPQTVKGIDGPIEHYLVVSEKLDHAKTAVGPLIGRRHELSELRRLWTEADAGHPSPGVALLGESGIGKSRLAASIVEVAEQSGARTVTLLGSPFYTDAGLHPVRALLERRCGIGRSTRREERLERLRAEIVACGMDSDTMIPLLAPVLGIPATAGYQPVSSDGRKLHARVVAAVRDYLLAVLGDGSGLILAEDLQWFDDSTLDVIAALLGTPTLVVCTARDGTRLPDGVLELPLAPMSAAETDELISATDPALTDADRVEVRRRSDGIPLYIEELVAKLVAQQTNASGGPRPPGSSEWERVPDALYEPLFARLRASDHALPVAIAAATIGRAADRALLLSVLTLTEKEVQAATSALENARVLEPVGAESWRFRHELLREVAAELPPPSQRKVLHSRIADALREAPGGQPDWRELAMHYEFADRVGDAIEACRKASADARRRGALPEARSYLDRALAHVENLPARGERDRAEIDLRLQRGFLISAAEGTTSVDAAADFERCLALVGTAPSAEMFATLTALYGYYLTRCDLRRARAVLGSVGAALGEGRDWFRPVNDSGIGQLAWFEGDFDTARRTLEECAVTESRIAPAELERIWFMPHEPIAGIHTNLALARFVHGDFRGVEESLVHTERHCAQLPFPHGPFSLSYARTIEIWLRTEAGQFDRAAEVVDDLLVSAEQHGFDAWLLIASAQRTTVRALAALEEGDVAEADLRTHLAEVGGAVKLLRAVHLVTFRTVFETVSARLYLAAGEPDRARVRIESALAQSDETGLNFYRAELFRHRAATWPDPSEQTTDLNTALELARSQGAIVFELRAALDLFALRGDSERGTVEAAIAKFPSDSTWPEVVRARTLPG